MGRGTAVPKMVEEATDEPGEDMAEPETEAGEFSRMRLSTARAADEWCTRLGESYWCRCRLLMARLPTLALVRTLSPSLSMELRTPALLSRLSVHTDAKRVAMFSRLTPHRDTCVHVVGVAEVAVWSDDGASAAAPTARALTPTRSARVAAPTKVASPPEKSVMHRLALLTPSYSMPRMRGGEVRTGRVVSVVVYNTAYNTAYNAAYLQYTENGLFVKVQGLGRLA